MANEHIEKEEIKNLPDKPGVYKFFDTEKELIYVGKAKSLKKRVSNYFNKQSYLDRKTQRLVSQIASIEFTIVNTEFDAYLLENNLIKNHQPKYNILLKDDKTYPYVCISNERFPRLFNTRTFNKAQGTYYGPYSSVKAINTITELARDLYQLRTCNFLLSEENIENGKYKVCLEYHIGNCKGPCEGLQSEEEYNRNIEQVHQILKGNISSVKAHFQNEMQKAAEALDFEKAETFKQKLHLLTKFQASSVIVNPKVTDLAVFSIATRDKMVAVNCLMIREGRIVYTRTLTVKRKLDETEEEILLMAIAAVKNDTGAQPVEILSNIETDSDISGIKIIIPKIGDKKKLVELSYKNASEQLLQKSLREKEDPGLRVIKQLQKDLSLSQLPEHIECFDNSNIQGTNPVAAMVCFIKGKPAKKEYRHYNIKTVVGPDDFGSMREIVYRRYKRLLDEQKSLPQLIVIDGGKGQLNAACEALQELNIYGKIPIIGIAKRLEEIFYPGDKDPLYIDKKSESLRLLQFIRNEAHRFAITFHRQKRSGGSLKSSLSEITGIGEKTHEKLIKHFKSPKRIKEAELSELEKVVGKSKAEVIYKFYSQQ
ncbi:excinuclease ABC subunit UvrC [Cytophagaceae bacterium ABcell3]|nr:excinuclease ABC subunit UvrC [Cytophagaceae bacterium ABcell3]